MVFCLFRTGSAMAARAAAFATAAGWAWMAQLYENQEWPCATQRSTNSNFSMMNINTGPTSLYIYIHLTNWNAESAAKLGIRQRSAACVHQLQAPAVEMPKVGPGLSSLCCFQLGSVPLIGWFQSPSNLSPLRLAVDGLTSLMLNRYLNISNNDPHNCFLGF